MASACAVADPMRVRELRDRIARAIHTRKRTVRSVELGDAPLEPREERLDVERAARDAMDQRFGRQLGTVDIQVLGEPTRSALRFPTSSSASRSCSSSYASTSCAA